jgi:hypothetical protein
LLGSEEPPDDLLFLEDEPLEALLGSEEPPDDLLFLEDEPPEALLASEEPPDDLLFLEDEPLEALLEFLEARDALFSAVLPAVPALLAPAAWPPTGLVLPKFLVPAPAASARFPFALPAFAVFPLGFPGKSAPEA